MKFTKSVDGKERANVRVSIRLTKEEIADIKRYAKEDEMKWRGWLEQCLADGVYSNLLSKGEDGSYEQRYGKGEGE